MSYIINIYEYNFETVFFNLELYNEQKLINIFSISQLYKKTLK